MNSFDVFFIKGFTVPDSKRSNIIISAKDYLKKTVNGCIDVSIMFLQDEQ